jgi:hypothetical protein
VIHKGSTHPLIPQIWVEEKLVNENLSEQGHGCGFVVVGVEGKYS